ncbi:hypothetical protein FRB99_007440 [Tulasnella sp. 403]|nr:hypothetical protein FRB99_007440 [Tulasnella sp. 403]
MDSVAPELRVKQNIRIDKTRYGRGGSCAVFKGRNRKLGNVALKLLRSEIDLANLNAEITTWQSLSHSHILQLYGLYARNGRSYMVSPWAENGSLPTYLQHNPRADRTRFIRETADALQYLSTEGIIHGDVKGDNILVSSETHVWLCDFGLSREKDSRTLTNLKTSGTPTHMAPELCWENMPKSFKTDIYAFGITIYEILSGTQPFQDYNNTGALHKAVAVDRKRPPKEPLVSLDGRVRYGPLWNIAERCWEAKATNRPSAADVYQELCELSPPPIQTIPAQEPTRDTVSAGLCSRAADILVAPVLVIFIALRSLCMVCLALPVTVTPGGGIVTVANKTPVYETDTGTIMVGTNEKAGMVAVKFLRHTADDAYAERAKYIRQEAHVWQQLTHPNILLFIGIAEDDANRLYLLSPWMENGSLRFYLPRHPDADRPRFILQTASALVYLHERGIIHGNVKASNVLVSSGEEPQALLCDFGLSRYNVERTLPGLKGTGTVRWQAPELWDNQPKSYRSDSYSFGMTVYEILSGNEPYHDCRVHAQLLSRIIKDERPPKEPKADPRTLEPWNYLWVVAERCWKREPEERPGMEAVYRWLENKRLDEEPDWPAAAGPSSTPSTSDEITPASPVSPLAPKKTTPLVQMG